MLAVVTENSLTKKSKPLFDDQVKSGHFRSGSGVYAWVYWALQTTLKVHASLELVSVNVLTDEILPLCSGHNLCEVMVVQVCVQSFQVKNS